jgi:hypothetical protein
MKNFKDLRENMAASLVSKIVKHTTPTAPSAPKSPNEKDLEKKLTPKLRVVK